ncbi:MAG: NapC/NirT family cytochrome c [Candidatus Accumulibacter sp.]|jgi:cytochrome c-type protein NapC|nr:NapC/NirT family cytochrome c [Accumulibacter sp.]
MKMTKPSLFRRGFRFISVGVLAAFLLGIVFTAAFNVAVDKTNTEAFCISCHEMKNNYREYQDTIHYANRSGMRAICSDCHVPKAFAPKMLAKLRASKDLYHSILGAIDTPEKFESRRQEMAQREWARMKANDSQECRNCHDADSFDYGSQGYRSAQQHEEGLRTGQTCIDCHKGIAHRLPQIDQGIGSSGATGISQEVLHSESAEKE